MRETVKEARQRGGRARAGKLTAKRRSEIARQAARKRWERRRREKQ